MVTLRKKITFFKSIAENILIFLILNIRHKDIGGSFSLSLLFTEYKVLGPWQFLVTGFLLYTKALKYETNVVHEIKGE